MKIRLQNTTTFQADNLALIRAAVAKRTSSLSPMELARRKTAQLLAQAESKANLPLRESRTPSGKSIVKQRADRMQAIFLRQRDASRSEATRVALETVGRPTSMPFSFNQWNT